MKRNLREPRFLSLSFSLTLLISFPSLATTNILVTPVNTVAQNGNACTLTKSNGDSKTTFVGVSQTGFYAFTSMKQGFDQVPGVTGDFKSHGSSGAPTINSIDAGVTLSNPSCGMGRHQATISGSLPSGVEYSQGSICYYATTGLIAYCSDLDADHTCHYGGSCTCPAIGTITTNEPITTTYVVATGAITAVSVSP